MEKIIKNMFLVLAVGIGTVVLFSSCDREDELYLLGKHRLNEEVDNEESGISFDMESDEMDEDVEELYFDAEEWGEERMDVDL